MYAVERLSSYISRGVYTVSGPFHPFGGAVDIIVVQQPDGSFKSSPWYVRFGKFQGVLKTREKIVDINVNGIETGLHMYLDHKGEAFFLKEVDGEAGDSVPCPSSSGDETDEQSGERTLEKSQSCDLDASLPKVVNQIDVSNGKLVGRTNSRRSRILGLMFGRRSMSADRLKEEEGVDAGVVRASSLERAELAADLLDMKWSTNLGTNKPPKDKASRLSTSKLMGAEADSVLESWNDDEQCQRSSFDQDETGNSLNHSVVCDESDSLEKEMCGCSESGSAKSCRSDEECHAQMSSLSILEQDLGRCTSGDRKLGGGPSSNPITLATEKTSAGYSDHCLTSENLLLDNAGPDTCILNTSELEASPGEQFTEEPVSDLEDVVLWGQSVSPESETDRIKSLLYCETAAMLRSKLVCSSEETQETLYTSSERCEVHKNAEDLHLSEVHAPNEPYVSSTKEHLNNLGGFGDRHGHGFINGAKSLESAGHSMSTLGDNALTESISSNDMRVITAFENEIFRVHQDTATFKTFTQVTDIEREKVEVTEKLSPLKVSSNSCMPEVGLLEKQITDLDCHSTSNKLVDPASSMENQRDETEVTLQPFLDYVKESHELNVDHVLRTGKSILQLEGSGEEHFLSSQLSILNPTDVQIKVSSSPDCEENKGFPFITSERFEAAEKLPNNLDKFVDKSRFTTSPIIIPGSHEAADKEEAQQVKSLPSLWSHPDIPDYLHLSLPSSPSLDSSSQPSNSILLGKDVSNCTSADNQFQLPYGPLSSEATKLLNAIARPGVEISCCKHLLYEGMGAEAASQAFDSEKIDVNKFVSLGSDVIDYDRLIVRIRDNYFPWEAAAPIISGMVSFGSEKHFEPKGMIAVNHVDKTVQVNVPHSGSWRVWPFSFQRSRSKKVFGPTLNDISSSNVENASDDSVIMDGMKRAKQPKATWKKVRTVTPTSEQLASLHLKEGKNIVTFTFSTAMLGKQQVDARIYLWKWDTRIVISDVDGTITKSDVLGQFMPMVGVDWSQTGVAHLFTAIKENGYQLLFLSARAISQAYNTRRFLFNLKQDGKALPDGPVFISPDGLFPSLFREVIRRAPHEFKISCLEDIRALFPSDCNPFYAGFGNRDTDEISYLKVGIPKGKIFIINPKGQVAVNRCVDTKSYTSLHDLVHGMFPSMSSSEQEDYNSWNFWKLPPPTIDI